MLPSPAGLLPRRAVVVTALISATLCATLPAVARPDGTAPPERVAAPVATPVPTPEPTSRPDAAPAVDTALPRSAVDAGCDVVGGLPLCSHGDDAHLATASGTSGTSSSSTASSRIGCYGDGRSGPRVQAIYARPHDAQDRLASMLPSFRGWAGAVDKTFDDSARKTGGSRHVRFATVPTGGGCSLSVLPVALPPSAFTSFAATVRALQDRDLDRPHVKYLVWAEATRDCGIASFYRDDKPGPDNLNAGAYPSYARIDRRCWGKAEAHELVHMLGGLQPGAPNATRGLHCSDAADVMCYDDGSSDSRQRSVCASSHARLLDCRGDDYYSTAPRPGSWLAQHWNVASSAFLAHGWTDPAPAATPSTGGSPSAAPRSPAPSPSPSATRPTPAPSAQPVPALPLPLPLPLPTLPAVRP